MSINSEINSNNVVTPMFHISDGVDPSPVATAWRKMFLEALAAADGDTSSDTDSAPRLFTPINPIPNIVTIAETTVDAAEQKGTITSTEASELKNLIDQRQFGNSTFHALMAKVAGANPG